MPVSNVARGARAKAKTKKWLEKQGYQVADLEVVRWVGFPKRFPIKRDQFGADLLAMNATEIIFVQVKSGPTAGGSQPEARRGFAKYTFPLGTQRWVLSWTHGARIPQVLNVLDGDTYLVKEQQHGQSARQVEESQEQAEAQARRAYRTRKTQGATVAASPRDGLRP